MKMIIAILNDQEGEPVLRGLVQADFRATRISSTGAFLRRGNTTLLVGLEDERVDEAIELIRTHSADPEHSGARRATVFVLDVARFLQV